MLCAGNERTFEVLEDVLTEVIDLFPGPYVHIAGDEGRMDYWKNCPKCQARIQKEGLKDEKGLQSYFIRRIERIVNAKGRTVVGWDEILDGGLAPNAVVMSWRGVEGGVAAANQGHDAVMASRTHCYFDYDYTVIPTEKAYAFEPVPAELTPERARHILGVQGCMWTHLARNEAAIDAMVLPRLLALAEVAWSPKADRNWDDFRSRMEPQYARLNAMGFKYRREAPAPSGQ
jgi:hexosaminidase